MTLVLGIESSCDETAAAVVRDGRAVLSSFVASQASLHAPYRGVVPEIASRSHLLAIVPAIEAALRDAGVAPEDLDAVAVTTRPGLIGSLLVGLTAAKSFAWFHGLPIVGVDHLAAHIYAATMEGDPVVLPAIALVASGGHTALYDYRSPADFEAIGSTLDDAAGEAFDKVSALLGLGYPGGPAIERVAAGVDPRTAGFKTPRAGDGPFDFSFSGLKTAVRYRVRPPGAAVPREISADEAASLAAGFQHAAVEHLARVTHAAARSRGAETVLVGGGVACNRRLRERMADLCAEDGRGLRVPRPALCADNAAMIAGLGSALFLSGVRSGLDLGALPNGSSDASARAR